jgi:hypothetical protein
LVLVRSSRPSVALDVLFLPPVMFLLSSEHGCASWTTGVGVLPLADPQCSRLDTAL